jgi:peptidoglycan/LPS O-acetylase OafA/YrhL
MAIKPNAAIPVLTFLIAITCYVEHFPDWLSFSLAPILLAFTVNHLVDTPKFFQSLLSLKVIRMVGIWSYSIYLWQQVFYRFSYAIPGGAMTGLFLSIIVGILSFYLYENPIRSWINNRWTKRNTAST